MLTRHRLITRTSLFIANTYNYHATAIGNAIAGWRRRKTPAGAEEAVGVITAVMECTNQGDYQTWYLNKCVCVAVSPVCVRAACRNHKLSTDADQYGPEKMEYAISMAVISLYVQSIDKLI